MNQHRNIDPDTGEIHIPFLRTPYNYDRMAASDETSIICTEEENKTQQQFKDDADINVIVERFGLTGQLPDDYRAPVSGDFSDITDFQTAMNAVRAAEENFMQLPPELRARFSNDPQQLLTFVGDERNRDEAKRLGLLKPEPEKQRDGNSLPLRVEVIHSDPPTTGKQGT